VNENILAAALGLDEPITLLPVEPLHSTNCHFRKAPLERSTDMIPRMKEGVAANLAEAVNSPTPLTDWLAVARFTRA
jgi:hypothetical protein